MENYVEEARNIVIDLLKNANAKYTINTKKFPTLSYEFKIFSPFKGKIVIKRWIHRARIGGDVIPRQIGEPGLIIEVSPGLKKASPELKKLVRDLLNQFNLTNY